MFLGPSGPAFRAHMKRINRVLPHPVSPIKITGIPDLMREGKHERAQLTW